MSKIGIIGGSFDPIHTGHKRIIVSAIEQLHLDELLIMPTKHNPWKEDSVASNQQRIDMINITMKDIEQAHVCTFELDLQSNEKNYTYKTLEALKEQYADDQLYFIMGMDQASQFDKWKKPKRIFKLVQLVAFPRLGYEKNDVLDQFHFIYIDVSASDESSSSFRDGNKTVVDENVLKYIIHEGLYLESIVKPYMSTKRYEHTCSVAKLARELAIYNGLDGRKAYIAGMLHDIAKEIDRNKETELMETYYPEFIDKPRQIYHQWLSAYVAKTELFVDDDDILQAIINHTTASVNMTPLDMCVYCADKLDPLRGYDSSKSITLCKKDIVEGFKNELHNFYAFSKENNRDIDECFFEVYEAFCKGDFNG